MWPAPLSHTVLTTSVNQRQSCLAVPNVAMQENEMAEME